jgi:hypothetical protein
MDAALSVSPLSGHGVALALHAAEDNSLAASRRA